MGSDRGSNGDRTGEARRLTVPEAAEALGISPEAVRTRLSRGKLQSVKESGRVFVLLDPDITKSNTDRTKDITDQTELVEALRSEVAHLRQELEIRTEEIRRRDHLLAAALERIPEIEAPQDAPRDERESPTEGAGTTSGTPGPPEAETGGERRRSWWREFFGFGG
jgi:hypothetical protein